MSKLTKQKCAEKLMELVEDKLDELRDNPHPNRMHFNRYLEEVLSNLLEESFEDND